MPLHPMTRDEADDLVARLGPKLHRLGYEAEVDPCGDRSAMIFVRKDGTIVHATLSPERFCQFVFETLCPEYAGGNQ